MKRIVAHSLKETGVVAAKVAKGVRGGEVFALQGELGAGKTAFVKAFAKTLGVSGVVSSPTFLLMRVYRIKNNELGIAQVVHVDAYRIRNEHELIDVGLGEYLGRPDTVVLIEWAEKVKRILPKNGTRWVRFGFGKTINERVLTLS